MTSKDSLKDIAADLREAARQGNRQAGSKETGCLDSGAHGWTRQHIERRCAMKPEIKCRRAVVNLNLQEIQALNDYRIAYGRRGFKCARSAMEKVIEAWKVAGAENATTTKKSLAVGNTAKLREACQKMRDLLMRRGDGKTLCILTWDEFNESQKMLRAALAAPARNCDVGTAEEQTRRMDAEYCYVQKSCYESPSGRECPLHKAEVDCRLIWAQMPYREGAVS